MHTRASRRKRFRAALVRADLSQNAWAEQIGVTGAHVSQVLSGKRVSATLTEKIDAFIAEHLPTPARVA